jgi:hypothetical protein
MSAAPILPAPLDGALRRTAVVLAGAGLVDLAASAVLGMGDRVQVARAFLLAFVLWGGVALGALVLLMLQYVTGGRWGVATRRLFEAAVGTLPVLALAAVPIVLLRHDLFEWTHHDVVRADPILRQKTFWLNVPFFVGRLAGYFAVWIGLAVLLRRWSRAQDGADPARAEVLQRRMGKLSGPGIVLWIVTVTFASIDLVMSLEPHWFSTMFGVIYMVGCGLSAFAFAIALLVALSGRAPLRGRITVENLHDLGKLLFAFVMLWAYVSVSQWIIVWQGNLPEEIPWYLKRTAGVWRWVTYVVVGGQFVLPFFLLLGRVGKRTPRALGAIAVFILVMRAVEQGWLVFPAFGEAHGDRFVAAPVSWTHVTVPLGFGAAWIGMVLWHLRGRPLLPENDPQLREDEP